MPETSQQPVLSVVVIVYDMAREAPRTLTSLSLAYQQGVTAETYEVVVVDNGSPQPLGHSAVERFGSGFSYHYLPPGNPSPAAAVNYGLERSRGRFVAVLVDGARMVTPGWIHHVELAGRLHPQPVIVVPGYHLGPKLQSQSIPEGYDQAAEDALLRSIEWPADGYGLFDIATLAASNREGWFRPFAESNAIVVSRETARQLGGYDEAFRLPGGGLCNLDFFARACALDGVKLMVLLGEGTFHQVHGGLTTGSGEDPWPALHDDYMKLRRRPFQMPDLPPLFLGHLPPSSLRFVEWSARRARGAAAGDMPGPER